MAVALFVSVSRREQVYFQELDSGLPKEAILDSQYMLSASCCIKHVLKVGVVTIYLSMEAIST